MFMVIEELPTCCYPQFLNETHAPAWLPRPNTLLTRPLPSHQALDHQELISLCARPLRPRPQGAPVYPPERERILGRHAKVTQRRQAEARRRNGALQMAYGMSLMAGVLVMLAESPVLRG